MSSPARVFTAVTEPVNLGWRFSLFQAALKTVLEEHRFAIYAALVYAAFGAFVLAWSTDGAVATLSATFPMIIVGNAMLVASVAGIWTVGFLFRKTVHSIRLVQSVAHSANPISGRKPWRAELYWCH